MCVQTMFLVFIIKAQHIYEYWCFYSYIFIFSKEYMNVDFVF